MSYVFKKTSYIFLKTLRVFRESLRVFRESLRVFRESLRVFRESLRVFISQSFRRISQSFRRISQSFRRISQSFRVQNTGKIGRSSVFAEERLGKSKRPQRTAVKVYRGSLHGLPFLLRKTGENTGLKNITALLE